MKFTNNENKRFLITGGCGFIGSSLIRSLLKDDTNIIANLDKMTYSSNIKSVGNASENPNYSFYKVDVCDEIFLKNFLAEYKPNYIIHLAAETHVDRSIDGPEEFIKSNILGTYNILNNSYKYWCKLEKRLKENFKIILVSTDEVFGSLANDDPQSTENNKYKPNSPYSASKASSDHLGRAWSKTYGLPINITNTTNNYGPWQFPEKLIPLTIAKCIKNENIPVYGNGQQIRDWIFVDDHVSGILRVLNHGKLGDNYNIGCNNELKNIDVVNDICSTLDRLLPRKKGAYKELIEFVEDRPGHDARYALNNNKIKKIGWKPNFQWRSGLEKTVIWYLENKDFLNSYSGERIGRSD